MLSELLNIKKMHLERAEQRLLAARGKLEQSRQLLANAKQALQDYQRWRTEEEKKVYAKIIGRQVDMPKIEQTRQHVIGLRLHDEVLTQKISEAKSQLSDAERQLEEAVQGRHKAYKTVEKYKAIIAEVQLEADREQVLQEEKEMEEVRPSEPASFNFMRG